MVKLITRDQFLELTTASEGINDRDFEFHLNEAQETMLKPNFPELFWVELLQKKDQGKWATLINGGDYTFLNKNYTFQGLKQVIAYMVIANIAMNQGTFTAHGFVQKTNPNSEPLSLDERKNFYYQKKASADLLLLDCVRYIYRNINDFESFRCSLSYKNLWEEIYTQQYPVGQQKVPKTRVIQ